jgi:ParB family chromosome partitioning protein
VSTTVKALDYRGDVKAALGVGGTLAFTTLHVEGRATGLYRLDADTLKRDVDVLPGGGVALATDGETIWVAGSDRQVYEGSFKGGKLRAKGAPFPVVPSALVLLAEARLAVLVESEIAILSRKDGRVLQTLTIPEPGTCLAADPSGCWLAAGTAKGMVAVFDAEEKPEFLLGESAKLHEGAVTALLFEPEELRFLSAGADLKLLSTLARGKLEPEDKGRGNNHTDLVTALIWGPGDRLYSGSRDGTIKSWPRVGAVKPATIKDGVGKVVALALVDVQSRPRLVAACDDNTFRFFPIDAAGKLGDLTLRVEDAYALAANELAQDDPKRREAALKELAALDDTRAVELISAQVGADADHVLRRLAVERLGDSAHPRAATLMERWLSHPDEAVRVATLHGLRKHLGEADLRPLDLALKVDKPDVGRLAVQALEVLARRDDQALARLLAALSAKTAEVRQQALASLENVHDPKSPEADLVALTSKYADVRRLALVRLFQRTLLGDAHVQAALHRRAEDSDPEVRRTAFLLSLFASERLIGILRQRDPELARQLAELEGVPPEEAKEKPKEKKAKAKPRGGEPEPVLEDADYAPLLQATASRALDTCLRGARGLALLHDPRAFGLLLQLSREEDKAARVEVCRALGSLEDRCAIERLRSLLHDKEAEVRDAAFTALARLYASDPLLAAESGLNAAAEDVRRRGLQVLIAEVRRAPKQAAAEPVRSLLLSALNDGFESVRAEVFKAGLNLQLDGGGVQTLRFLLRSIHADLRREVLNETMAQVDEPWGWDLLLEFFNDPDPKLRDDAFSFAVNKTKGVEFLDAALGSRHADLRKKSVDALIKKRTPAAQALLQRALADEDREVRLAALGALVAADAIPALTEALGSAHGDVRVRAARALARHGDAQSRAPMLALATAAEPLQSERQKDWLALAEPALIGLGELGDPAALPQMIPLLDSKHAALRQQAARALIWCARADTLAALRQALQHDDPKVKYSAALGLAYAGDPTVTSLVFSKQSDLVLTVLERLAAAMALGPAGEDWLILFLDHENEPVRNLALLLLLIKEWKAPDGTAARLRACLAARSPRMRLTAARGLETLSDPAGFAAFVVQMINDRGDKPAWQIAAPVVNTLADLLVHGEPLVRARTFLLLRHLGAEEQDAWDQDWAVYAARFAPAIDAAGRLAGLHSSPSPRYSPAELRELAFGAYVGLVREQGGSRGKGQPVLNESQVARVRQTALSRLLALARSDPHFATAARPVLVQALGDPNQAVRLQAFEHLQALGLEPAALAVEALATGHTDLGVQGLQLLAGGGSDAEGQAVLEQAMLSRPDDLAIEAAKLLIARRNVTSVAARALEAANETLRKQAVAWLAAEYDKDETARDQLRKALQSRYLEVRRTAALELATKKDPVAFPALVQLLADAAQPAPQRRIIQALITLGDPRAPGAFLDRLENDPGGTALATDLVQAAGSFRRPEDAERLLAVLEKDRKWRAAVVPAVQTISGYDQRIDDPEDEQTDRGWESKQFPRHDPVLVRLMERLAALNEATQLVRLIPGARWARGREVEPVLASLVDHPDESLRQQAVAALGWRLRKREAKPDALLRALGHRDPVTQFLAAEALAKAGRSDGLNVLLASIDYVSDLSLRYRAVLALGELADERALEPLLRFAGEEGHALQEPAAEAIGHLGRSAKAEEVFKILERHSKGEGKLAMHALKGLRWLNTAAGWQLIRRRAGEKTFTQRDKAVELLGENDDAATRDLLLRVLAEADDEGIFEKALTAARRLWGTESLEPDYAAIQNEGVGEDLEMGSEGELAESLLKRIAQHGEPRRLFEILARCRGGTPAALASILLGRPSLPLTEARAALDSRDARTAGLAARILGRAGSRIDADGSGPALLAALRKWRDAWEEHRRLPVREHDEGPRLSGELTPCLRSLVWAVGRTGSGVAGDDLIALAAARPDDSEYRPIRLEAVSALAAAEKTPEVLAALEAAALTGDPEVRSLAADAVGRDDLEHAPELAARLLSDRPSFQRLARGAGNRLGGVLRGAVRQVHAQGVVLPSLIAAGDVEGLADVAGDATLSEVTRLGAVEGLAAIASEPAEAVLRRIGTTAGEKDEELRKAAWRGLRRARRARESVRNRRS